MISRTTFGGVCCAAASYGSFAGADPTMLDDFDLNPQARGDHFADGVMGGVSDGGVTFVADAATAFARKTGTVSTENNGSFLQTRRLLPRGLPAGTEGLKLETRGNGAACYVFLRTRVMPPPWYFYNAAFQSTKPRSQECIPLTVLERSHDFLADPIEPQTVIGIGLVACGRHPVADLSAASVAVN